MQDLWGGGRGEGDPAEGERAEGWEQKVTTQVLGRVG